MKKLTKPQESLLSEIEKGLVTMIALNTRQGNVFRNISNLVNFDVYKHNGVSSMVLNLELRKTECMKCNGHYPILSMSDNILCYDCELGA